MLRRGDMVAAVAPAGPPNRTFVEQGRALLREWGLESRLMPNVFAGHTRGFLAAEDDARAGDLQDAFADPRLAGVVCLRGGYGSQRLLDRLDFEAIAANPKAFVGFSDVTALHVALSQRAGLFTYHGPNLGGDPRRFTPAGRASLRALLFGRPGATLHGEPLRPGRARAQLVGGNTLCGTPDSLDARGRILLIEEVGEAPYRIDRALTHLRRAGVLEELAGLAVASFWRCEGPTVRR